MSIELKKSLDPKGTKSTKPANAKMNESGRVRYSNVSSEL